MRTYREGIMPQVLIEDNEKEIVRTKKETILALYKGGIQEIETIASIVGGKPSYVAAVLQGEGLIERYFDLYTSTGQAMNVYSKHFQGRLGFKDVETAERGVLVLDAAYRHFDMKQDRAGQHHALEMGLVMLDRARWTGKLDEAEIYRRWLMRKLSRPLVETPKPEALKAEKPKTLAQPEQKEFKIAA